MSTATITIKATTIARVNVGEVPKALLRDLVKAGGDGFSLDQEDTGWTLSDLTSDVTTTLDEVTVE